MGETNPQPMSRVKAHLGHKVENMREVDTDTLAVKLPEYTTLKHHTDVRVFGWEIGNVCSNGTIYVQR